MYSGGRTGRDSQVDILHELVSATFDTNSTRFPAFIWALEMRGGRGDPAVFDTVAKADH
jgi:hypothetical protein